MLDKKLDFLTFSGHSLKSQGPFAIENAWPMEFGAEVLKFKQMASEPMFP